MQALRFEGPGELHLRDVPLPLPGDDELLVRIEAAGICGTDRHVFHGEYSASAPVTLGHEFSGIVEALGRGVSRFLPGDRVTVDPNIACGTCDACRAGRVNLCSNLRAIGLQRDGGFATHAAVPHAQAVALPRTLDPLHGAFCEPLACCIHGVDLTGIRPGGSVIVLGGGVIGMFVTQLARLAGATRVVMATRQAAKRQLAERLGATASLDPAADNATEALVGPGGLLPGGADAVIECAGVAQTVEQAPSLAKRGGTVVILGVLAPEARIAFSPFDILVRELRILGSFVNPFTHARAADLIASNLVQVEPLISRRVSLADAVGIIRGSPPPGEIRAIVDPRMN